MQASRRAEVPTKACVTDSCTPAIDESYNGTMILGSHLSIAGGCENALVAAHQYGFDAVALFVRNQRQWTGPELDNTTIRRFRRLRRNLGIRHCVAHGSYLVNLASEEEVWHKSVHAVADDLRRCGKLGIEKLVIHPGSHPDLDTGLQRIVKGLDLAISRSRTRKCTLLLENTAGQGNCIGHRFEDLAEMIRRARRKNRLGYCLDTAHAYAAGYDLRTARNVHDVLDTFDRLCGLDRLGAIHLNDSKKALGSHVDRHEHIGRGAIGKAGFAALINDRRLESIPFILETPKGTRQDGRDWDTLNSETIHRLLDA